MKIQKAVLTETKHITIGVLIGDAVMCGVFAALKKFDYTSYDDEIPYYTMIIREDGHKIKLLLDLTEEMLHTMKTQFPEKVFFA